MNLTFLYKCQRHTYIHHSYLRVDVLYQPHRSHYSVKRENDCDTRSEKNAHGYMLVHEEAEKLQKPVLLPLKLQFDIKIK